MMNKFFKIFLLRDSPSIIIDVCFLFSLQSSIISRLFNRLALEVSTEFSLHLKIVIPSWISLQLLAIFSAVSSLSPVSIQTLISIYFIFCSLLGFHIFLENLNYKFHTCHKKIIYGFGNTVLQFVLHCCSTQKIEIILDRISKLS